MNELFLMNAPNALMSIFVSRFKILAYHGVQKVNPSLYDVSLEQFDQQMTKLYLLGYKVVDLNQATEYIITKKVPKKVISITFDDGYMSVLENAIPILDKYGYKATIFVPTSLIGKDANILNNPSISESVMTWSMLQELSLKGFTIGSHSVTHRNMTELCEAELIRECDDSLYELENHIGHKEIFFAYPFGLYNKNVKRIVCSSGYVGALGFGNCMSNWEKTDLFMLKREKVLANTHIDEFVKIIDPSNDLKRALIILMNYLR